MGHEFSGTITELGKGVDTQKFAVGDNVVAYASLFLCARDSMYQYITSEPVISCMEPSCGPCSSGTRNICPHTTFIGIGGRGGGLAEYIAVDQESVHVLPAGISLEIGALMEPLAVVWHAVKRSNFTAGDSVLIIGAGPIGLLLLKVLRALDASWVGVSEPASQRRDMALKLSASAAFDPLSDDIVSETARATDGRGAAVVFDCAGIQASLDTALAAVRARGNVVEVAVWETSPVLDIGALQKKEIILTASQSFSRVHSELLQAVAGGKLTGLEDLITRKIALEEFVDKGIKALIEEKDSQIKILVHP
ncbi:hypothetical protein AcW1_002689 [Taiwanofungus camphoratus]|nr:hypothetical protein AcW1_002689 [Antrodia cinnamomea]